ncbi:response regulator [Roseimaritima ulvae]|uniref:Transcriptional regulatory protein LiaR n=1 Tax=Roseimaritima ulvae TaxID=980254 RepID=A0A5B9R7S1_9BACT|nr:response regulator transcription factor [Roseimaritima ulvae]QEG42781.1 Transcriptional regulatory protein LiaR [Roseimaritima ulvae]
MSSKLLIIDDHEVVRVGLAVLLASDDIVVVGATGSLKEAHELAASQRPDLILLDVRMAGGDGLGAIDDIRSVAEDAKFVVLSTYDNPTYVARAVAMGASDYLLKGSSQADILAALRRVAEDEPPSEESLLRQIRATMRQTDFCTASEGLPLTTRELQVLRHIGLGLSNREIGTSLDISVETVKEHVQNILRKMNAVDRTDAAVRAVKLGVV